jgi:hypothetical protein
VRHTVQMNPGSEPDVSDAPAPPAIQSMPLTTLDRVDAAFFAFSALAAIWLAYLLIQDGDHGGRRSLFLVVFWLFVTYLLLPRVHRLLTRLYLPGYFIGRARTSDGLLGDPVNLALLGREGQIHRAMTAAGWILADPVTLRSSGRIIASTLSRRSYREAPVSPLHLFGRQQDFAYQQEVEGSPSKRHHVRFWRCPDRWRLPGGYAVDWLAAGTYDKRVGLSLFTLQVTHKIEADIDVERDFIIDTATSASPAISVDTIFNFSTGYHTRNGGGDMIETDGHLPVLDVRRLEPVAGPRSEGTDSRDRRPMQTVFGAGVAGLRSLIYLVSAGLLVVSASYRYQFTGPPSAGGVGDDTISVVAATIVLLLSGLGDLVLATAVLRGRNWARLWLMSVSSVGTVLAFLAHAHGSHRLTVAQLLPISGSILVLMALSSQSARTFATRRRTRF